jgi:cytochrome c-type biogenesis protein CcmH/NrfG
MDPKQQVEELRTKGNQYFQNNKFNLAVECYTKALELDPKNPVSIGILKIWCLHVVCEG